MCPVKTENLALNVSRPEGEFWRRQAARAHAKSRGDFQKNLLLAALERFDRRAAAELRRIREHYRQVGAVALVLLFCGTLWSHDQLRRPARRVREQELVQTEITM